VTRDTKTAVKTTMTSVRSLRGSSVVLPVADTRQPADKRRALRHRTLKGALIAFKDGAFTFDCVVRNLSAVGANLSVATTDGIPKHFELHFDDRSPGQICEVVWRSENRMGVLFEELA
jgi:hypothetical protein